MTARTRIAVVGAGAWGVNHVRAVTMHPGCELRYVVDPDETALSRARQLAPTARCEQTTTPALRDPAVDAVVIATPATTHAELACAALAAGKHVLIEKPVAFHTGDVERIDQVARAAARLVVAGHLMVFHPAVVRLRELLCSHALGTLRYIHSTRANLGRIRSDESVLWSFGPHELSMLDYLLEDAPVSVSARGQQVVHVGVEDVAFVTLRYPQGEMAHVHLSRIHPRKERTFTMVCADKLVEFDDVSTDKLRIYEKGYERPPPFTHFAEYLTIRDGDVHIPRLSMTEPLRLQLQHFIECITTRRSPRSDLRSVLRVTAILEAAQASLAQDGEPTRIKYA